RVPEVDQPGRLIRAALSVDDERGRVDQRGDRPLRHLRPQVIPLPHLAPAQRVQVAVRPHEPVEVAAPRQDVHGLAGPAQHDPEPEVLRRDHRPDQVDDPPHVVVRRPQLVALRLGLQLRQQPVQRRVVVVVHARKGDLLNHSITALRPPPLRPDLRLGRFTFALSAPTPHSARVADTSGVMSSSTPLRCHAHPPPSPTVLLRATDSDVFSSGWSMCRTRPDMTKLYSCPHAATMSRVRVVVTVIFSLARPSTRTIAGEYSSITSARGCHRPTSSTSRGTTQSSGPRRFSMTSTCGRPSSRRPAMAMLVTDWSGVVSTEMAMSEATCEVESAHRAHVAASITRDEATSSHMPSRSRANPSSENVDRSPSRTSHCSRTPRPGFVAAHTRRSSRSTSPSADHSCQHSRVDLRCSASARVRVNTSPLVVGPGGVPVKIHCGLPSGEAAVVGMSASRASSPSSCASSITSTSTVKPRPDPFERATNSTDPPLCKTTASWPF